MNLIKDLHMPHQIIEAVNIIIEYLSDVAEPDAISDWITMPLEEWKDRTIMEELEAGNLEGVWNMVEGAKHGEGGY